MLIIRRKTGESVLVGDDIEISVVEVSQGRVVLGIRAPENILVLRKEIQLARAQNREASQAVPEGALKRFLASYCEASGDRAGKKPETGKKV